MRNHVQRRRRGDDGDHDHGFAPGKVTRSSALPVQRKAEGAPAAAPGLPFGPVDAADAAPPMDLLTDRSFVDSLLDEPVQRRAEGAGEEGEHGVHALAAAGTARGGGSLPFLDQIQASFGRHDVGAVQAHTDGAAAEAAAGMGATAFATGNHVAFAGAPDLHTAAHEAAHVVQQRAGVHLKGGVGEEGDAYEAHADEVADAVVAGESAEDLLDEMAGGGALDAAPADGDLQMKKKARKPVRARPDGTDLSTTVQQLYKTEDVLDRLQAMATVIDAKDKEPEKQIALVREMVPVKNEGVAALTEGWKAINHFHNTTKKKFPEAKAEALAQPGMDIVHTVTKKLGLVIAAVENASPDPKVLSIFMNSDGSMPRYLGYIRGNLGLPHLGWDALRENAQPTLEVRGGSLNLGSGSPRDHIQESCLIATRAWDQMLDRMSKAVIKFIHTIQHAEFKDADFGIVGKLWDAVKGMVSTAATIVSGTPLAAKYGIEAITKIINFGQEMEKQRKIADEKTFLDGLQKKIGELEQEQNFKTGGFADTIDAIDNAFLKIKTADKEDQWAEKRRVVFDKQAEYLTDLRQTSRDYAMSIPGTDDFVGEFLTQWITSNHKMVNSHPIRMPTTPSKVQDGYVAIDLEMKRATNGNWYLATESGATATLKCPKSSEVAEELTRAMAPFDLSKLHCDIQADISYDAGPGKDDPRDDKVSLDPIRMSRTDRGRSVWGGVTANLTTDQVLARFTKLDG